MARARSLKPGFFKNETLAELPPMARLLFAGMWTLADREGRLEDRPKRIKAELFPYDHDCDLETLLDGLSDKQFIIRYEVNGERYISIPTFDKHQAPHYKEPNSSIPSPNDRSTIKRSKRNHKAIIDQSSGDDSAADPSPTLVQTSLIPISLNPIHESSNDDSGDDPFSSKEATQSVLDHTICEVAESMHKRHPKVRNCAPSELKRNLIAIAKGLPSSDRVPALRAIDRRHAGWCASPEWMKDGGQYAKGLDNWTAPTKDRWKREPPGSQSQSPPSEQPSRYIPYTPPVATEPWWENE